MQILIWWVWVGPEILHSNKPSGDAEAAGPKTLLSEVRL